MLENINLSGIANIIQFSIFQKIGMTILLIVLLIVLNNLVSRLIKKQMVSKRKGHAWQKLMTNIIYGIGSICVALFWFSGIKSTTTFLGLITAGLAFALRDLIADMAGYIFVLIRRPISVGDRVEIMSIKGDIISIDWFQFSMIEIGNWVDNEQSTGRIVYMPMAKILTNPLINYNGGFDWIWNEFKVVLTFESDINKAKKYFLKNILRVCEQLNDGIQKALKKALQQHLIEYTKVDPIIYTKPIDYGIECTIRYFCPTKMRRESEELFWTVVLPKLQHDPSIQFADSKDTVLVKG